jgi:hypothetical protein
MEAAGVQGPVMRHALRSLRAGQAALGGRADEAVWAYREVLEGYRATGLRRSEALVGLLMAAGLGPDHPAVAEPLEGARRIFTELRAQAWLDRLDEIVARGSAATADPSGGSASEPTSAAPHASPVRTVPGPDRGP